MARFSSGVSAISRFSATDPRQAALNTEFTTSLAGRPGRSKVVGTRGYKAAGFGGYETDDEGNLVPAGSQSVGGGFADTPDPVSPQAVNARDAELDPGLSTANDGVQQQPIPQATPPLQQIGTSLAGTVAKEAGKKILNRFTMSTPKFDTSALVDKGAALGMAPLGNTQYEINDQGLSVPKDTFVGEADFSSPAAAPAADVAPAAAAGPTVGENGLIPDAQYTFVKTNPESFGEDRWVPSEGERGGSWQNSYTPETHEFMDQYGNTYITNAEGLVLGGSGDLFGGAGSDFASGFVDNFDSAVMGDLGAFGMGDMGMADFGASLAADEASLFADSAGAAAGFDLSGVPIGAGIKLLQGDVEGAAKSGAGFLIGNAIVPGIGGIIGGMLGSACFITEAVMQSTGQGDDAPELQILRWFRDNVMLATPHGQAMAQEYVQMAPIVVEALAMRPDAPQIYAQIKSQFIDPAVEAIQAGNYKAALEIYSEGIAFAEGFAAEMIQDETVLGQVEKFGQHAAALAQDDVTTSTVSPGGPGDADFSMQDGGGGAAPMGAAPAQAPAAPPQGAPMGVGGPAGMGQMGMPSEPPPAQNPMMSSMANFAATRPPTGSPAKRYY